MKPIKHIAVLALTCFALGAAPIRAEDGIQQKTVQFPKGKTGVTLKGRLSGDDTVDYRLSAKADQTMDITLKSNNGMNYFNLLPPQGDNALFVGSSDGNHYSGTLPQSGVYTVRVYLMRAAARRKESANYTLDLRITGK